MKMSTMGKHVFFLLILFCSFGVQGKNSYCESRNKCSNNQNLFIPACYCDAQCLLYRDCCKGYLDDHRRMNNSYSDLPTSLTCELLTNQKYFRAERVGAFMVKNCKGSDVPCQVNTGDLKTIVPVSTENVTFRNADCALCNNITSFKYWNIVFSVSPEYEKELKSKQIATEETMFDKIRNGTYPGLYYLHPPGAVTPRFCPYDVRAKEDTLYDKMTYQNPILCNDSWYKNEKECLFNECCGLETGSCFSSHLNFFKTTDNVRTDIVKSFHITMKFEPLKADGDTVVQVETEGKVFFNDILVYIVMELKGSDEGPLSVVDCVYSMITFLGTTPYQLVPRFQFFSRLTEVAQEIQVLYLVSRSTATLTLTTVSDLLQLQYNVVCEQKDGNDTVYGNVKVITKNEHNEVLFRSDYKMHRMDELQRFKISSVSFVEPCRNLSIVIHRSHSWRIPVEVSCSVTKPDIQSEANKGICHYMDALIHVASIAILFVKLM